jgi:hypothetical protein
MPPDFAIKCCSSHIALMEMEIPFGCPSNCLDQGLTKRIAMDSRTEPFLKVTGIALQKKRPLLNLTIACISLFTTKL